MRINDLISNPQKTILKAVSGIVLLQHNQGKIQIRWTDNLITTLLEMWFEQDLSGAVQYAKEAGVGVPVDATATGRVDGSEFHEVLL